VANKDVYIKLGCGLFYFLPISPLLTGPVIRYNYCFLKKIIKNIQHLLRSAAFIRNKACSSSDPAFCVT